MGRFVEGEDRRQSLLLPESLDDDVTEDNPVRVVEVLGATHFLTRTLEKVRTGMSLRVLAYNMKRMIKIFGVGPLMAAIRA